MILWVILFVACMIWMRVGAGGVETAATAAAMFLTGPGVRSFLRAFWREHSPSDGMPQGKRFWKRSSKEDQCPEEPRGGPSNMSPCARMSTPASCSFVGL